MSFKVVCIEGRCWSNLIKDEIYTVKAIRLETGGLKLEEIESNWEFTSGYFDKRRFRPLDESFADKVIANVNEQIKEDQLVVT